MGKRKKKEAKSVIIVGGTAKRADFNAEKDKGKEIWTINGQQIGSLRWLPWVTRTFNVHKVVLLEHYGHSLDAEAAFNAINPDIPLYTIDQWPHRVQRLMKNWRPYPLKEVMALPRGDYHCGSADWLICAAIVWGFEKIEIRGYNLMLEAGEPMSARACMEYWAGYAMGKGIDVTASEECGAFHNFHMVKSKRIYGIDDNPVVEIETVKPKKLKPAPYHYES